MGTRSHEHPKTERYFVGRLHADDRTRLLEVRPVLTSHALVGGFAPGVSAVAPRAGDERRDLKAEIRRDPLAFRTARVDEANGLHGDRLGKEMHLGSLARTPIPSREPEIPRKVWSKQETKMIRVLPSSVGRNPTRTGASFANAQSHGQADSPSAEAGSEESRSCGAANLSRLPIQTRGGHPSGGVGALLPLREVRVHLGHRETRCCGLAPISLRHLSRGLSARRWWAEMVCAGWR